MAEGLPTSLLLSGFYLQQFNYQAPLLRIVSQLFAYFSTKNIRGFNGKGLKRYFEIIQDVICNASFLIQ